MLSLALGYARDRNWRVFPLASGSKLPIKHTHGHNDATTNPDRIRDMWRKYPDSNIGIATGRESGFFVLDVDVKDGKAGDSSLADLEKKFGKLPDSVECITWSGGRQIYFTYPKDQEIRNSQSKIGQDIDIRGEGGYVVAPGSIVHGKPYEWEISSHPDDVAISDAPDWLIDLIIKSQSEPVADHVGVEGDDNIPDGQRNEALMKIGVKLRKMGLKSSQIDQNLQVINSERCCPPLAKREVAKIAKSVSRYKTGQTRDSTAYTDVWNAEQFVEKFGNRVKYCDALGGWFVWDGTRWRRDQTYRVLAFAKRTAKEMFSIAQVSDNKVLYKHAVKSESEARLKAMTNLARSQEGVSVESEQFDADEYLLNCRNGVLDLKSGRLKEHSEKLLISKICGTKFDPSAECPRWLEFLDTIFFGNDEIIRFVQKAVGYVLTGDVSYQMFFILHGAGANGKSTFVDTIYKMLGSYAMITPTSTLTAKRGNEIPNDVARLKGARFVVASELSRSNILDESLIKQLTSTEPLSARYLHKEFFEFRPTGKVFLSTNYRPTIRGTDDGIWRRIKLIPFDHKFEGDNKIENYAEKYLFPELPGILRWAVDGFLMLQREGFHEPEVVMAATNQYKESEDVIGSFLSECCVLQPHCKCLCSELYDLYKQVSDVRIRKKDFNDYLVKCGYKRNQGTNGKYKARYYWQGIGIKDLLNSDDYEEDTTNERPF